MQFYAEFIKKISNNVFCNSRENSIVDVILIQPYSQCDVHFYVPKSNAFTS